MKIIKYKHNLRELFQKISRCSVVVIFISQFCSIIGSHREVYAQSVLDLPAPGSIVRISEGFFPPCLKGMKVDLENPLKFDFILDNGMTELTEEEVKREADRLIKYFLASLTIPEEDLWVNLSPYEKKQNYS